MNTKHMHMHLSCLTHTRCQVKEHDGCPEG